MNETETNPILEKLKCCGAILSYSIENISWNKTHETEVNFGGNYQKANIIFPNGETLVISSVNFGGFEDTGLDFENSI